MDSLCLEDLQDSYHNLSIRLVEFHSLQFHSMGKSRSFLVYTLVTVSTLMILPILVQGLTVLLSLQAGTTFYALLQTEIPPDPSTIYMWRVTEQ